MTEKKSPELAPRAQNKWLAPITRAIHTWGSIWGGSMSLIEIAKSPIPVFNAKPVGDVFARKPLVLCPKRTLRENNEQ